MAAGRKGLEFEIPDSHALHSFHRVARLKQAIAQFVAARVGKCHLVPGRVLALQALDSRAGGTRKLLDFRKREERFQFHQVGLRKAVRFQDTVGQIAIVRKKDEPRSMVFEPSHWEDALGNPVQQIPKRPTPFGVTHRGNDLGRLVQQQVDSFTFRAQQLAGNFDVVARMVRLRAKFCNHAAIHGDVARGDEFFRVTPRGDAGACDYLLESFEHFVGPFIVTR
jgi:hypothetical protein